MPALKPTSRPKQGGGATLFPPDRALYEIALVDAFDWLLQARPLSIEESCWEPWGLFRKPCEGRVQDNLRKWKTGGLRRLSPHEPFKDLIPSAPPRGPERELAPHPSLKPQAFLRQLVRAALPFGQGAILDPFMGSGSTIAAALACGLRSVGLESNADYFQLATRAIPALAELSVKEPNANGAKRGL